jgi:hypothetical protein
VARVCNLETATCYLLDWYKYCRARRSGGRARSCRPSFEDGLTGRPSSVVSASENSTPTKYDFLYSNSARPYPNPLDVSVPGVTA